MRTRSATLKDVALADVATVGPEDTLQRCAELMRKQHVGSLVVVEDEKPVGVITDRDIVIEAVAVALDPATLTAGDVMSEPVTTVGMDDDVFDALAKMRGQGVRRLPVVAADGHLQGIVAVDNLLEVVSQQLDGIVELVKAEQAKESTLRGS